MTATSTSVESDSGGGFRRVAVRFQDTAYGVFQFDDGSGPGQRDTELGMENLRSLFPDGEANSNNFVIFSSSGVHGSYLTIEDIEANIAKYGEDFDPGPVEPSDWCGYDLTVLIVHPRIVCLKYGNVRVRSADLDYLKKLRSSSRAAMMEWNEER
jgi:hypothetical protein